MHVPVLLQETIEGLAIQPHDIIVDATLGGGGHSRELCKASCNKATLIGIDADKEALGRAEKSLQGYCAKSHFIQANFRTLGTVLESLGIEKADKFLFDLGLGTHSYEAGRGFSFQKNEPLLMTLSANPGESEATAYDVVNTWSEETIADILYAFGDEKYARRIARAIVFSRQITPIQTTFDLVAIIEKAVPPLYRFGRIHFATRTFQAIRIAVNDELTALEEALNDAWQRLSIGGRIAVISFHSLEDRIVKRAFLRFQEEGGKVLTKRPLVPSDEEKKENPRSRSAKLRLIEKP